MRRCEHPKKVDQRWNDNFQEDEAHHLRGREQRGEQGEVRGQRREYAFEVNTNEVRCECQRRQADRVRRKNKVEMQDITRKYKVVNYADKDNVEWNTELTEAMELEHVMSQAAQNLNDGETRHGSWEAQSHEHEYLLGRSTRTPVHQEATHKLNCQTS